MSTSPGILFSILIRRIGTVYKNGTFVQVNFRKLMSQKLPSVPGSESNFESSNKRELITVSPSNQEVNFDFIGSHVAYKEMVGLRFKQRVNSSVFLKQKSTHYEPSVVIYWKNSGFTSTRYC